MHKPRARSHGVVIILCPKAAVAPVLAPSNDRLQLLRPAHRRSCLCLFSDAARFEAARFVALHVLIFIKQ